MIKKYIKIGLFVLSALYSASAVCYNIRFSNGTERMIVISYKLEGLPQNYYQIIPSDQSVSYYFPNAHCFGGSILWAEYKDKDAFGRSLPYGGGMDLIDPISGEILKGENQRLFEHHLSNKYAFIPMQIKVVDDATYQFTANAIAELASGINDLAIQAVDKATDIIGASVPKITPTSMFSKPALSTIPHTPTINTTPTSYIPEKPKLNNNTPPNYIPEPPRLDINTPPNYIPEPPKLDINTPPNYIPPTPEEYAATLNTSIDIDRNALGKIAQESANLYGLSLCRDLHFLIVDTGEIGAPTGAKPGTIVSRIKKPILIAEINQGG